MATNNTIIKLIDENQKLKTKLSSLQEKNSLIQQQLDNIYKSKAYKLWALYKKYTNTFTTIQTLQQYQTYHIPNKKISEKISIIIPTRNGGPEFKKNLIRIIKQKGIPNREIIVLDNNSSDDTSTFAKKMRCRLYHIKENEFGHGKTRAFGVTKASGEYIIYTGQDVYIDNPYGLCKLVNFMKKCNLHAASGIQKPNQSADCYAIWQNYYHYKILNPKKRSIYYKGTNYTKETFSDLSFINKRKLLCIDDVISCYKKDIFNKVNFDRNLDFAEDADIAKKIILSGKNIGITSQTVVLHSHNIDPIYALKRAFVDSTSINKIFNLPSSTVSSMRDTKLSIVTILFLASYLCQEQIASLKAKQIASLKRDKSIQKSLFYKAIKIIYKKQTRNPSVYFDNKIATTIVSDSINIFHKYESFCTKENMQPQYTNLWGSYLGNCLSSAVINSGDKTLYNKIYYSLNKRV